MSQYVHIMLVEDDPDDVLLIEELVAECNHAGAHFCLHPFATIEEALADVDTQLYHIVLLDLNLPGSQGLDTLRTAIRYAQGLPIVVMTGLNDVETGIASIAEGASDFLVKSDFLSGLPRQGFGAEKFTYTLRNAIERSRIRQMIAEQQRSQRIGKVEESLATYNLRKEAETIRAYAEAIRSRYAERFDELAKEQLDAIIKLAERRVANIDASSKA